MFNIDWEILMLFNLEMVFSICMLTLVNLLAYTDTNTELWGKLECVKMLNMWSTIDSTRDLLGRDLGLVFGLLAGEFGSSLFGELYLFLRDGLAIFLLEPSKVVTPRGWSELSPNREQNLTMTLNFEQQWWRISWIWCLKGSRPIRPKQ